MNRFVHFRGLGVSVLTLFVFATVPAKAQSCLGDCNASGSVTIDELLVGLNIALGADPVGDCAAFEGTTDGAVTVDELVRGVRNALRGCPSARAVKASSSVALSSLYVMDFGSLTASGGAGAQSLALADGPTPPAGVGGAAGVGCDTLLCPFGGTEVRCCDLFGLSFEWTGCVLADGTEVNGSYSVESDDADPCLFTLPSDASAALAPPPGIAFLITFTDYSAAAGDFLGNFNAFVADFTEEFFPYGAECSLIAPDEPLFDPLGFAIRGDGTRYLQGAVRMISGNGPSILQDVSTTFGTSSSEVSVDVIIDDFSAESCLVDTQLDGSLSTTNLLTGREFTESYEEFFFTEWADIDGSVLIELEGTSTTDCLGPVELFTSEPLKIFTDRPCPAGGRLEVGFVEQQSMSTVSYTGSGGIELDFGSDGSIDEARASCIDLSVDECSVPQTQGLCTACSGPSDCDSGLVCASCVFCEISAQAARCAPQDDFAVCDDGVFGDLFIDIGF